MPRRGSVPKRKVQPDPIYKSKVLTKLINQIMQDGQKSIAEKIVYEAFEEIRNRTGRDPMEVFDEAMKNIMPVLEVKARRVGGANYQVPVEVRPERRQTLAIRWLVRYMKLRKGKSTIIKLAEEIIDASNSSGSAVKKKEDTHKMAEANKAFAHYRW